MCTIYIILLFVLVISFYILSNNKVIKGEGFSLDTLRIPVNPVAFNEIAVRNYVRIIGIDKHVKLDKYNNVEKILFKQPTPESGETYCKRVICPYYLENIACWKCY